MRVAVLTAWVLLFSVLGWAQDYLVAFPTLAGETIGIKELARGRWVLAFVVLPNCPACEKVIRWLGQANQAYPGLNFLLFAPWLADELEAASSQAGLALAVDKGGRLGAGLGVKRAPTVVFFLDGRPVGRLDWPFTEAERVHGLDELATTPRAGPWQYLGAVVSLGTFPTLEGEPVNLDELPGPVVLSFFNPLCSPCWEAFPILIEARRDVAVVLILLASHALSGDDRQVLREAGLRVVLDDEGELAQALAVRVTPTYVIRDGKGVIRWIREGAVELKELRRAVLVFPGE